MANAKIHGRQGRIGLSVNYANSWFRSSL